MQVHARLSIIGLRDIAYQAQDLALLVDLNGLVLLAARSNQPTSALENAPIAVIAAPSILSRFAKSVIAWNASSP
jgi:hypothetical protein